MSLPTKQRQILGLIGWLVASFAASAVGAVASIQARSFYSQLAQPAWAPPAALFGPVWTVLYVLMAIAAWLVRRSGGIRANRIALSLFLARTPSQWRSPHSVLAMGQFRICPQLLRMAAQPPGSRLVACRLPIHSSGTHFVGRLNSGFIS